MSSKDSESEKETKQNSESEERSQSPSPASKSPEPNNNNDGDAQQSESTASLSSSYPSASPWQAVWAPQYNAYYFYNSVTQETTWTNPLPAEASSSSYTPSADQTASASGNATDESASSSMGLTSSAASAQYAALQAAAVAQGIDPGLAHLDPSLRSSLQGTSNVPGDVPTFTAQFNAHTGKFAAPSSRTPGHLSEYERMKRMSEFYFDVNQWEEDLAKQHEAEESGSGKKRKRPSKKDLERFKEQKRLKKIAKTAWLRT